MRQCAHLPTVSHDPEGITWNFYIAVTNRLNARNILWSMRALEKRNISWPFLSPAEFKRARFQAAPYFYFLAF
jgi:hypothetical protein